MIGCLSTGAAAIAGQLTYNHGAFILLVSGVDRAGLYNLASLRLRRSLGSQAKLDITLKDTSKTYSPQVGEAVELHVDGEWVFGGSIETVSINSDHDFNMAMNVVKLNCVDHERLSTRYVIAKNYETPDQTLRDVVSDIVDVQTPLASEDSVRLNMVEDEVLISDFVIDYKTLKSVLDDLTRQTGHHWSFTPWKHLNVEGLGQTTARNELTDANPIYTDLKLRKSRSKYRNKQYLKAGAQKTVSQSDAFAGDGKTQTFTLRFKVDNNPDGTKPTVKIDDVPVSESLIGVRGADEDSEFEWLYNVGENTISQSNSGTPLTSSQTLAVEYVGQVPTIIVEELEDEKTDRKAIEGGSGLYENVEQDDDLVDRDFSVQRTEGFLSRFGKIANQLDFSTRTSGFNPGQILTTNLSALGGKREYLIQSVELSDAGGRGKDGNLWYKIRASSPPFEFESWVEFFTRLYKKRPLKTSKSNEKTLIVRKKEEQVSTTDSHTEQTGASVESNILDPDSYDPYTAAIIGDIDSQPSMVIGFSIIGTHHYQK